MPITFVGANAGVSGNNASLSPTIHASAVAGDLIVVLASIRSTAASVVAPAGYAVLFSDTNVAGFSKVHTGTESAPLVTFTGGAAGDDTLAQVAVFRGVKAYVRVGPSTISNASAANITLPATVLPDRDGCLMLYAGWKQDDWTTAGTIGTAVEIGEVISTAGNDAAMVWDYQIQTTATTSIVGSWTITGGVAAISKAYALALDQAAAISVIEQDVYPPRTLVSVTNLVLGDGVAVYRSVGGVRTLLRDGSSDSVTDTSFLVVDAELPYGVPVTYVAVVDGAEYSTAATSYTLTGGKVAVTDAIAARSAEVVILAWPEKTQARRASVYAVGGRSVAVVGDLGQPTSNIELYVETTSSLENLLEVLTLATSGIVQIRQPGGYDGVDSYLVVLSVSTRRFSQDGSDERRTVVLQAAEVEGWAPALAALGYTYQDLADVYAGLTYASVAADYATYLLLAQGDFSP